MTRKHIWSIVVLVGGYIACQLLADIGATKVIQLGAITMPAGTFVFALTFTLRDLVHKRLGKAWAQACIVAAGIFNVAMSGYLASMAALPSAPFYALGDAWASIFAIVPAIVLGSIGAEVTSELIDTEVYHLARGTWVPQWGRVLLSNAVSLPIDSIIFALLAFVVLPPLFGGSSLPIMAALSITMGQIVFKGVVTIVSLPLIYLVRDEPLDAELLTPRVA